jgi:hypothetical protein
MSLLNTTDTGSGANVPDAAATTKWKDYIWVRRLGTSGEAKFYIWNENATSDATYLKWQEKSDVVVSDIPMTDGQLLIGGSSNVGTAVALGGDATVANTGVLTIANSAITNAKVDGSAAIAYSKLNLGSSITNANLAGSIGQDKLAGSIPWSKLTIADAEIPFGRIDKIFEKNIDVQNVGSAAPNGNGSVSGNYPEYSTPTGLAIPNGSQALEGIYRVIVSSGSTPSTITLPDPSSGTYDGKIFKLSIYRANDASNKGPVYVRIAGKSPTVGSCNVQTVSLTLPSGHGFVTSDKVSIMGVFDNATPARSYEADGVTATVSGQTMTYTMPTAAVTSITETGGTATVTTTKPHPFKAGDKVYISGATPTAYNTEHSSITRTSNNSFTFAIGGSPGAASGTILVSRSGLGSFTSQRGVVVKSHKLVDNTAGVLADMISVIGETSGNFAKKVVLDITCDSRSSGDGQWLVSGHGGSRQQFSKTGTTLTVAGGQSDITAGSSGSVTFASLTHKPKAGDVISGLHSDARLEVTTDTASNTNVVTVKNTGSTTVGAADNLTQAPAPGSSAEFIAEAGSTVFFDPVTGVVVTPPADWEPKKPGFLKNDTP